MSDSKKDKKIREVEEKSPEQSILGKDEVSFFVLNKIERLTAALFLVTGLLGDDSQLKTELRAEALRMFTLLSSWSEFVSLGAKRVESKECGARIIGLLRVAVVDGELSAMNCTMLTQEYLALLGFISENEAFYDRGEEGIFDETLFHTPYSPWKISQDIQNKMVERWSDKKWNDIFPEYNDRFNGQTQDLMSGQRRFKDTTVSTQSGEHAPRSSPDKGHSVDRQQVRRDRILSLLRLKGKVSVRDVSEVIKDCSEKTLQRELVALVKDGVLKKEGERRWSTYSLASG